MIPLALVGVSFRDASSATRAALLELDSGPGGPSHELVERGIAHGIVRIETCARVEWLVSADEPRWAADLLAASLQRARADTATRKVQTHCDHAALVFLLRMAVGLDSVAQGEHAIGRQILQAFERAHSSHRTDRTLRLCWRRVAHTLSAAHQRVPSGRGGGVHVLAIEQLKALGIGANHAIGIFGTGEMGRAVANSLRHEGLSVAAHDSRATMPAFLARTQHLDAIVVCSGAPKAWLTLPERADAPAVVDVGSPAQVVSAPGWRCVALDDLLTSTSATLPERVLGDLETLCASEADALAKSILQPSRADTLRAMAAVRREFLSRTLPALLDELPAPKARAIEASVGEVMHQLLREARGTPP
jgi:glutamyl-tRNA reductase